MINGKLSLPILRSMMFVFYVSCSLSDFTSLLHVFLALSIFSTLLARVGIHSPHLKYFLGDKYNILLGFFIMYFIKTTRVTLFPPCPILK